MNEGANEAFLQPDIRVRPMPHRVQVRRQIVEFFGGRDDDLTLTLDVVIDAGFDLADALQRLIPAPLQFVGHQSVVRVRRIVLLLRAARGVLRGFQFARPRVQDLILLTGGRVTRDDGGLDAAGCTTRRISLAIAASTTTPPNEMQRGSPLSRAPRTH